MEATLARGSVRRGLCLRILASLALMSLAGQTVASERKDRDIVAGLHAAYQVAAKRNDAATMRRILDDRFVLVLGDGRRYSRADLLAAVATGKTTFERQDDDEGTQTLRVFGDTAVVTAQLWLKGIKDGIAFDRRVWFSDIYIRTPDGWRCAFTQLSPPLRE